MPPLIVIIDNNEVLRATITSLADEEGWTVFSSNYAGTRLTHVRELNPDLIVLDFDKFRMGGGWEFLQVLKMEETTASIPIIVIAAAFDLPREIKGYLATLDITVISKPLNLEHFFTIARKILARQDLQPKSGVERPPIILLSDDPWLTDAFATILEMEGYQATTVPNGRLALNALRNRRHGLIFLDMHLPDMNSREFMAAYALQPEPHTPVVIFSTEDDPAISSKYSPFVIGRLPKIFRVGQLLEILRRAEERVQDA